jgi:hypothetical protein
MSPDENSSWLKRNSVVFEESEGDPRLWRNEHVDRASLGNFDLKNGIAGEAHAGHDDEIVCAWMKAKARVPDPRGEQPERLAANEAAEFHCGAPR